MEKLYYDCINLFLRYIDIISIVLGVIIVVFYKKEAQPSASKIAVNTINNNSNSIKRYFNLDDFDVGFDLCVSAIFAIASKAKPSPEPGKFGHILIPTVVLMLLCLHFVSLLVKELDCSNNANKQTKLGVILPIVAGLIFIVDYILVR